MLHTKNVVRERGVVGGGPYHLNLPVNIPLFHIAETPGFDSISSAGVHPDHTVVSNAD